MKAMKAPERYSLTGSKADTFPVHHRPQFRLNNVALFKERPVETFKLGKKICLFSPEIAFGLSVLY